MDIRIKGHEFFYDITSLCMMFFPGQKVEYVNRSSGDPRILQSLKKDCNKYICSTRVLNHGKWYSCRISADDSCDVKNLAKRSFYKACARATGITSAWGTLTGIRPLSVYNRHLNAGGNIESVMKNEYLMSEDKIKCLAKISDAQASIVEKAEKDVSIYISIPFCPSRCSYCSFISVAAAGSSDLLQKYLELLTDEIRLKSETVSRFGLNIKSIYIGGGTPGILSSQQLTRLLETLFKYFDISPDTELCFELGRPDSVTLQKLEALKSYGVNRICINTQTTNDDVLKSVNRAHTGADYFKAMKLAHTIGFNSINTDLIAGLPGESVSSFCRSVDQVMDAGADNITVHTLSIKRSSALKSEKKALNLQNSCIEPMLNYAYGKLDCSGYIPYYIYRQKNCVSNGENVGFCLPDKICRYNVYMMEDVHTIIACGAGASSKFIDGSRVTRIINVKYPMEYISENFKVINNINKTYNILKDNPNYESK